MASKSAAASLVVRRVKRAVLLERECVPFSMPRRTIHPRKSAIDRNTNHQSRVIRVRCR